MSHLEQRVTVTCPPGQAALRIGHFFKERTAPGEAAAKLSLSVDVNVPGLPAPLSLQRSVVATIAPHHLPADMTPRYRVEWTPAAPGPFPSFLGELVVGGQDDYDTFSLCLTGGYTPPLGLVGKGFDAALGNRLAQTTASDLLATIKEFIEREFKADEARKPPADPGQVRDAPVGG